MPYEIAPTTSFATDEQIQEHLEELLEDGHDLDEMKEFIETHGNSDFMCYYEDYARMIDQYDDESYIDGLLTTGFHRVDASEMFGEEVIGYSLY